MAVMARRALLGGLAAAMTAGAAAPQPAPVVIGHRGACALRPEHTLASYALAIADGADFVEPDLVATKDGVLILRHDNDLSLTTDVKSRPQFAGRKTAKTVDGVAMTGWFSEDFSLAEIKTLRAVERLPDIRPQNRAYDGAFEIPTFAEFVEFVAAEASARGRAIGIAPELKHSTYFAARGLPLEDRLLAALSAHAYTRAASVIIQSFERANLNYLRAKLGRPDNIKLLQLIDEPQMHPADAPAATYAQMLTPAGLKEIARYADIVAPWTRTIIPTDRSGKLGKPSTIGADAAAAGLALYCYTMRPENLYLPAEFRDGAGDNARNPAGSAMEIARYAAAGVTGFFTDDPAIGRRAADWLAR